MGSGRVSEIEIFLKKGYCSRKLSVEAPDPRIIRELGKECVRGEEL